MEGLVKSKSSFFISVLRYLFLVLSIAPSCFMERDFMVGSRPLSPSSSSSSSLPWASSVGALEQPIEIVGPRDFHALSGDLVLWTRLSPLVFNLTGTLDQPQSFSLPSLYIQLLLAQAGNGDEGEKKKPLLLATQPVPLPITTDWEKVVFPCNVIVQGGQYILQLIHVPREEEDENEGSRTEEEDYPSQRVQILSNITLQVYYPTIVFEVPHSMEAYTTSTPITYGFPRSPKCEAKRDVPIPPTVLVLSICNNDVQKEGKKTDLLQNFKEEGENDNDEESDEQVYRLNPKKQECIRDFAILDDEPYKTLQKEGHITQRVGCHLWARNATYRVQLVEKSSKAVIARSRPIRVEWGSQFSINMSKPTVMPCRGSVKAIVSYPSCVLPGRDKIRVYGHEMLSVPSILVPSRLSYIGEHKIQRNSRVVTFRCNLFPQRFLRFCFQYINTAVDDSVAIVMEKCIPTSPPMQLADGGWGPWSPWTSCTVTCGQDGRQYRYRFCDNPPPSSGANFCQGESIEERVCDNIPECPPILFLEASGENSAAEEMDISSGEVMKHGHGHSQHRHTLHQLQVENVTLTPGCECGCILYDLVSGKNETLVIFISSNYSSPCADEDEVDHHKFRWIFHTKDERDHVRLEVVEMEVQCVTITFRDGNTTDSNLLQVITSEEQQSHYEDLLSQTSTEEDEVFEPLTLESSGASMSISAFDTNKNCTGQFIYFIAYYSALPSPNASQVSADSSRAKDPYASESWSFLILKTVLLFFAVVVILSGFGGCVTKAYRKKKYNELKCFDNDDEGSCSEGGTNYSGGADADAASRCTSVTLMSFDYAYWRRMRLQRLKYFLLRPRPLTYLSSKVNSFPNTPTRQRKLLMTKERQGKGANRSGGQGHTSATGGERLSKSISLSETNLRVEKGGEDGPGGSHEWPAMECKKDGGGSAGADGAKSRRSRVICSPEDPLRIGTVLVSNSSNGSQRTDRSTPTDPSSHSDLRWSSKKGNSEKLLKEKENLKRRANKRPVKGKEDGEEESGKISSNLTNKNEGGKRRQGENKEMMGLALLKNKRDIGKSQLSMSNSTRTQSRSSLRRCNSSSCGDEDSSRAELEDADQDFEMDYYDYDPQNVSTIPGSYLGLEPAFVLWNSEVYEGDGMTMKEGGEEEGDQEEDANENDRLLIIPTSSSNASYTTSTSHDEGDIEMTATASSSLGIFSVSQSHNSSSPPDRHLNTKRHITIRETSLDTLKFADEEDYDDIDDDNATQASDSIFDNEHEHEQEV